MKKSLLFILFIFCSFSLSAQYGQNIDVSDALQSALDIRTSGVKIVKDYVYRGLKSGFVAKETDNNLAKGERALLTLEIYTADHPEIKKDLNQLKTSWKKLRILALQKPERKKMDDLLNRLNKFLTISNKVIEDIKNISNLKTIDYQEASNSMELLAQQMTLLYALDVAGIQNDKLENSMNNCKIDFQKNLDKTFYSGENTIQISNALKKVQADWEMSKRTLAKDSQEQLLNTLYVMMNKISEQSRKAANLYQQKAKERLRKN
jgi:hypothetical protein